MKITSIISEYNPLHNGHLYHMKKTKEITNSEGIICIMSGNYVQRGLPAMIDKWNRTKVALQCGADLVIELPVLYSLSSAEFFAYGAVSLLNSLGIVESICFGSEEGNMDKLNYIAKIFQQEPSEFKLILKNYLSLGYNYPTARSKALYDFLEKIDFYDLDLMKESLSTSNNILGIEYCKSLIKLNSSIKPYTIKREGASYNSDEIHNIFSSATAIRKYVKENKDLGELKKHIPFSSYDLLINLNKSSYDFPTEEKMLKFLKYKSFCSESKLENLPDVSEGIQNKIYKAIEKSSNYIGLIENVKSKRFTHTRINRILCQYFIGFEKYNTGILRKETCPYARVLGFNEMGTKILKKMKNNSNIPIFTKLPKTNNEVLDLEVQATKSYSLLNSSVAPNSDYLISPIMG